MMLSAKYVGGVLAVAVGAFLVPATLAAGPDDQADPRGPGAVAATALVVTARPDDRAEARGPGTVRPAAVRPDDRAETRGPGATTGTAIVVSETGFDWGPVALVAVIAVVAALVVGGVMLIRHHGGPGRLAPHT